MRRQLGHGLCIATLLVITACSGDDDAADSTAVTSAVDGSGVSTDSADTDASTDSAGSDASTAVSGSTGTTVAGSTDSTVAGSTGTTAAGTTGTTVAGSGTTVEPVPTSAVPSTLVELTLLSDGVGPLKFGTDGDTVILMISAVLGGPISDAPAEYPTAASDGSYTSLDGELSWTQPFGRTVCWANGLCGEFGGAAAGPYTFDGWYYAATDLDPLAAPSGLSVGSTWAEFADRITVDPGGCFSVGSGTADGVTLALQSSGEPFVGVDQSGNEVPGSPDPADVEIMQMQAGDQVTYLLADC